MTTAFKFTAEVAANTPLELANLLGDLPAALRKAAQFDQLALAGKALAQYSQELALGKIDFLSEGEAQRLSSLIQQWEEAASSGAG